jgi:transposase
MKPVSLYDKYTTSDRHGRVPDHPDRPRTGICPLCGGLSQTPTTDGRTIIDFIRASRFEGLVPEDGR